MSAGARSRWLVRHGETERTRTSRRTGRTAVLLTSVGEQQATAIPARIGAREFALVPASHREEHIVRHWNGNGHPGRH